MKDTVVFDLDGTLLNTLCDLADSVNFALESFSMPVHTYDEIRSYIGNGVAMLIKRSVPKATDEKTEKRVFACFKAHYLKNMRNKTAPYEGIVQMLSALRERNIKTGVVSNKLDSAVKTLCEEIFGSLITFSQGAVGESDRKPNPQNLIKCIETLGSKSENCIYIGDSEVDIQTAENAGVEYACVLWGYRDEDFLREHGATRFLQKPDDVFYLLSTENPKREE